MMKRTVFISSTFEDLQQHRAKIWDVLGNFDVNIRGMERFGARTESPLETCMTEVEQSDIYVGIIAMRLGSIESSSQKSYTQLEYEKALDLGKEILIYLFDENNGIISPKFIDYGEKHDKLVAFKKILRERHTIDTFTDEKDISEKLTRRFNILLTKKVEDERDILNEYVNSSEMIERFCLLPKLFSGREIKINVEIVEKPFPASKLVCDYFNLSYGQTIGVKVKYLQPVVTKNFSEYLFIERNMIDAFFSIPDSKNIELYAKLLFSENRIADFKANFVRQVYYSASVPSGYLYPFQQPTIVEADGTMIVLLTRL